MNLVARLGYVLGVLAVGAVVGQVLLGTKKQMVKRNNPPVAKLAEQLGQAWAPYHRR